MVDAPITSNHYFGNSVASAGDVNGDGYADVIIGAQQFDNVEDREGGAFVYHGSPTGLGTTPAWTAESDVPLAYFGYSVDSAGDVNGDGYSDVIVGARAYTNDVNAEGAAFVYHGSASGLSPTADWSAEGNQDSSDFGNSVAGVGDVDGDGYSEVVVGAYHYDVVGLSEGKAFLYKGSAAGLSATEVWDVDGGQDVADLGNFVSPAGDINADGYADVLIGVSNYNGGTGHGQGRALLFLGSSTGLATSAEWTQDGPVSSSAFGATVSDAGDVNGDGFGDIIIGAPNFTNDQTLEGAAFLYYGSSDVTESVASWDVAGGSSGDEFGFSARTAGDVNGDGFGDVIIGAPGFDNGESNEGAAFVYHGSAAGPALVPDWTVESDQEAADFGTSVSYAGDMNGDGFDDVIVGAPFFETVPDESWGKVFVYPGSASGLSTTPSWTETGTDDLRGFGHGVSDAGDMNGDGYGDVIVGSSTPLPPLTDSARVYLGSPSWSPTVRTLDELLDTLSESILDVVSSAGDVNGDGFSDVIAGDSHWHDGFGACGAAFVFLGSPTDTVYQRGWTYSDPAGCAADAGGSYSLGHAVSSAGDVNGDGFSDVMVGTPGYSVEAPTEGEGRAEVFLGSASGLATTAAWSFESNMLGGFTGVSLSTAGDVNGDGFSDVVTGGGFTGFSQGSVDVFLGSSSGLSTTPAMSAVDAAGAIIVQNAGDVNGDGFGDVIVGDSATPAGRTLIYYGNAGGGLDRIPRQYREDDTAPIALLGQSDDPGAFRVKFRGRHPGGRGKIRLEVELTPLGTPFDGGGTIVSSAVDTGDPAVTEGKVDFNEVMSAFTIPDTAYKWRARILTDSPVFPPGPWFGMSGNALTETDLLTPDTTSPWVTSVVPPLRAKSVSRGANVTVSFSEPINAATVHGGTFTLSDGAFGTLPAGVAVAPSGLLAVLDPVSALVPATTYTLGLTSGVTDVGGAALVPFSTTFTTENDPGTGIPLPDVADEALGIDSGALTGSAVSGAGDLNGDGINDFLGGAPGLEFGGKVEAGAAAVYFGSALGSERTSPDILFFGDSAHDRAGVSVSGDFDFDGDGVPDILIGAEQVNRSGADDVGCTDGSSCGAGKVYLIYFDPTDLALYPNIGDPLLKDFVDLSLVGTTVPGVVFEGAALGDRAGFAIDGGGRFDAGAGDDIAIGGPGADTPGGVDGGRVYVIFDDPSLSGTISLSRVANGLGDEIPGVVYEGFEAGNELGFSLNWPGNVVGGAGEDLAMGAPRADPVPPGPAPLGTPLADAGIVYIADGGGVVTSIIESCTIGTTEPGAQVLGDQVGMLLGFSVAGAGDNLVNGEDELLMGAPLYDPVAGADAGQVAQTSGVIPNTSIIESCTIGTTTDGVLYTGTTAGDQLGYSVEGLGDVTGNGLHDVAFGAPFADPEGVNEAGAVYLVEGTVPTTFTLGIVDVSEIGDSIAGSTLIGVEEGEHAGSAIAETGDISGDGQNDFVIGAPDNDLFEVEDSAGQIYLVLDSDAGYSDVDGDGVPDELDCEMTDGGNWGQPGEITDLLMTHDAQAGETLISWSAPEAGTTQIRYDVIRSTTPDVWDDGSICVDADNTTSTSAIDTAVQGSGEAAFYLVRAENDCPDGSGSIGDYPNGQPRLAIECPNSGDSDGDGFNDVTDNCPAMPNDQTDTDDDGVGDVCDNCPSVANVSQLNSDADTLGDACDNCPADSNPEQHDCDSDSLGDACDPGTVDPDNDDVDAACDNCPSDSNVDQSNSDTDSHGDACDNCPFHDNEDQADGDEDGEGDVCENLEKTVFVSSTQSNGDLGGVAGADATCNALAVAAGLTGSYKAWLSDDIEGPATTFTQSSAPYTLVNDAVVAFDWADLTDGSLVNPIVLDENGVDSAGVYVWSATAIDGSPSLAQNCATAGGAWTESTGGKAYIGATGLSTETLAAWTTGFISSCGGLRSIYCFEQ